MNSENFVEYFEVEHQSVVNFQNMVSLKKVTINIKFVVKNEYTAPANKKIKTGFNNFVFPALRFNILMKIVLLLLKH